MLVASKKPRDEEERHDEATLFAGEKGFLFCLLGGGAAGGVTGSR